MTKYKKGKIVKGTVTGIESYGVFVVLDEYYNGLIHISEISHNFVHNIHDYVELGDIIYVEILEIDEKLTQTKLSIKNINYKNSNHVRNKKIVETNSGFKTLSDKLSFWIEENIKKNKKSLDSIDKQSLK